MAYSNKHGLNYHNQYYIEKKKSNIFDLNLYINKYSYYFDTIINATNNQFAKLKKKGKHNFNNISSEWAKIYEPCISDKCMKLSCHQNGVSQLFSYNYSQYLNKPTEWIPKSVRDRPSGPKADQTKMFQTLQDYINSNKASDEKRKEKFLDFEIYKYVVKSDERKALIEDLIGSFGLIFNPTNNIGH
ncbi:hypothetical protein RhiirC2_775835 [Rhizophagus irregularis]|uniref:Uncharacterized protein n=1 Tax=Rhizophagus irregularis TaxID=588596 RepID=A0A2N1NIA1_9GLOM|nr:hypothetical protein RhiirC2_775835 [Rhizophagus irregularis]